MSTNGAASRPFDVVVVGSCAQDLVSYCDRFPTPGETIRGRRFAMNHGGKGANQAVTAAKLGARVGFVGRVGNDLFGTQTVRNMQHFGIDVEHLRVVDGQHTGTASICVDQHGENCIVIVPGANLALGVDDIGEAEQLIERAKVLTCQLEIDTESTKEALSIARKHHVTTIFNPAPAQPQLDPHLLALTDIFCPNKTEAQLLTGLSVEEQAGYPELLDALLSKGCRTALITLGAKGCVFKSVGDHSHQCVPAPKVDVVDSTGAGDAFIGSLAFYCAMAPDLSLYEKIRRASIIASESVKRAGTQPSYVSRDQLPSSLFDGLCGKESC